MNTMLVDCVAALIVVAHDEGHPGDEDWDNCVGLVRKRLNEQSYLRGVLVTTRGGAPNAGQRKALQEVADSHAYRTCIYTDSMVARGVIIAINCEVWLLFAALSGPGPGARSR